MMLTTEPAMAMMDTVTPMQMTANTASSAVHATLEPVLHETLEPVLETLEPVLEPRPVRQGNLDLGSGSNSKLNTKVKKNKKNIKMRVKLSGK